MNVKTVIKILFSLYLFSNNYNEQSVTFRVTVSLDFSKGN